jgi:hypothetical protein
MKAPRRGVRSPPRLELSGSEPSHEPQSRSVKSSEKSTRRQQEKTKRSSASTAKPKVFVEGMRKEFSASASDGVLLQRGMPAEGEAVVAVEKPAAMAGNGERPQEAATTKRPSSRTAEAGRTCDIWAGKWCAWVITSRSGERFFSEICDRPGCYECFKRTRRSPLQRFCSHDCRRALERVLERERRWRERGHAGIAEARKRASVSASLRL